MLLKNNVGNISLNEFIDTTIIISKILFLMSVI